MARLIDAPPPGWLAGLAFCAGLNELELDYLAECVRRYRLSRGRMLFDLGGRPAGLYILASGQVSLWTRGAGRNDGQPFHYVRPGEAFGVADLLSSGPCSHMAWAHPGSTVVLAPQDRVLALMAGSPAFVQKLFNNVCEQLQALETGQACPAEESAQRIRGEKFSELKKMRIQNVNYH